MLQCASKDKITSKREDSVRKWIELVLKSRLEGDFATSIHDGINLCQFVQIIDPRSIPIIYTGKKYPLQLKLNIFFFISACEDLGVPRFLLPNVEDVFLKQNTIRVIECLEALAKHLEESDTYTGPLLDKVEQQIFVKSKMTPPQTRKSIEYFNRGSHIGPLNLSDKFINFITSTSTSTSTSPSPSPSPSVSFSNTSILDAAQKNFTPVKDDINYSKNLTLAQAVIRRYIAKRDFHKLARAAAYRANVAKEIYETEESYVKTLQIIVNVFMTPLRISSETDELLITKQQFRNIFSEIQVILGYAQRLLSELKPRYENWGPHQTLGDIFLNITQFLKVYTQYVKDHDKRVATINNCRSQNPHFASFLEQCTKNPLTRSEQITSLLIHPIQRIPRYKLLLDDMVKHTQLYHPDFKNLSTAATKIKEVTDYIESRKLEADAISKVLEIEKTVYGLKINLAEPHRRFIKEGHFLEVLPKRREKKIFLFNDLLLVTTIIGKNWASYITFGGYHHSDKSLKFHVTIHLKSVLWIDIVDGSDEHCFQLQNLNNKQEIPLTLCAKSEREKEGWRCAIESAAKEHMDKENANQNLPSFQSQQSRIHLEKKKKSRTAFASKKSLTAPLQEERPRSGSFFVSPSAKSILSPLRHTTTAVAPPIFKTTNGLRKLRRFGKSRISSKPYEEPSELLGLDSDFMDTIDSPSSVGVEDLAQEITNADETSSPNTTTTTSTTHTNKSECPTIKFEGSLVDESSKDKKKKKKKKKLSLSFNSAFHRPLHRAIEEEEENLYDYSIL